LKTRSVQKRCRASLAAPLKYAVAPTHTLDNTLHHATVLIMPWTQNKFVADGFERWLRSPEYQRQKIEIETQVRAKFDVKLSEAKGFWERRKVKWQMDIEVRRTLTELGSSGCLWISRPY
jgi:hypothetical protein